MAELFPGFENPLSEAHFQEIHKGIGDGELAYKHMDLAERAGIDVSEHRKRHDENMDKLRKIKAVYFPGR
jgi:hypothetical protein